MAKSAKKKNKAKTKTMKKSKPAAKKKVSPKRSAPPKVDKKAGMHDAREVVHERRFEVRNLASKMTFASVALTAAEFLRPGYSFKPEISVLLVDISVGGCSLVFMKSNPISAKLVIGARCVLQITPDAPRLATLRWLKNLDSRLVNAGFQFE